jgi:predicted RNA-binding Zn-ribbon protein involved in translation (DUF1610 family)
MIKCPTTGHEFSTGIQIKEDSLGRLPETMAKSLCPHCGGEHIWWTRESHLVEDFGGNFRSRTIQLPLWFLPDIAAGRFPLTLAPESRRQQTAARPFAG